MASIGLCMIVKNEAHVIRRCLDSVLPLVDYFLIVDTGSTDDTQGVVQSFLSEHALSGIVLNQAWQDFAYNRSSALQKLRERPEIDYALMIDADEVLVYEANFNVISFKNGLSADLYNLETRYGGITYLRPQLFSNRLPFYYKGVLHEYLECEHIKSRAQVIGFYNHPIQDSARARNPKKFHDDAKLLETAIERETDPFLIARYTFYLAQCYRDAGEQTLALNAYLQRAQQGFWQEEVYVSLLNAARLKTSLGYSETEQIQAYMDAHESMPTRLEALHDGIRACRLSKRYQQGYMLAKHALTIPVPTHGLFVEKWITDYGLLDEFSIVAYWTDHFQESLETCNLLLQERNLPENYRKRVKENAAFASAKLNSKN